ncbi:glycoside hydrolase family 13 protein [Candidatus Planktophila lacus]|uniref:glycoside hydrolase family 13 protein n=1 Tax=Candidatus Planktophila lacus TaxID=1884913 RepID=UPI000BACD06C|nr:glycoside hydrolase family 13 protein [Candidatus Planktophila lacus]
MSLSKDKNWWRQAVVYQIYPRSFKDSNGDGLGDIKGITSKIDYLSSLSLDAVWLSPFYPSALVDGGYDVDDYRDVDPKLGSLADFDEMLTKLHAAGIRIFVDIVPNHSSNLHLWFKEALAAEPGSAARNRYIFRDGKGANGELPPTDWPSHFAPSAWTHESKMGGKHNQWYCHLFAPEQPDWNWDNREIEEDFLKTLKFWADRGVDGFRIDVAHAMKKDLSEPLKSQPRFASHKELDAAKGTNVLFDRNEVHEVYKEWRKLFNQYDPPRVAVAEANVSAEALVKYASTDELGQSFNFEFLDAAFNAYEFKTIIDRALGYAKKNGSSTTWCLNNHDQMRPATKFGLLPTVDRIRWRNSNGTSSPLDEKLGTQSAVAASMLIMALPGCTYIYQGEELGIHEVMDIPEDQIQDPQYLRNLKADKGRDGCRVPLPWTKSGSSFGFGDGGAHLPQPKNFGDYSIEVESADPSSPLSIFRKALALRKNLITAEEITWHETGDNSVLHFSRPNGLHCITNFGRNYYNFDGIGEVIHASGPLAEKGVYLVHGIETTGNDLPPATTVWVRSFR